MDAMADNLERGRTRVQGFVNPEMDYQLMRQLGSARYGGASVGECLALAQKIGSARPAAWVDAFEASGKRHQADAEGRAARGHAISARDQYLEACNSYRAAEYYTPIEDDRHRALGLSSRRCFMAYLRAAGIHGTELWFHYQGLALPAYHIHQPEGGVTPARMLAIVSGFDGTLEESWIMYGAAAFERGYDLLLFTGPGQMDAWRFHDGSHFAPDFEQVGRQVADYVTAVPGAYAGRLALMGISFGGYFATRIAAHEPRFSALIANSPIIDLHAYMVSFAGVDPAELSAADDFRLADLPQIPDSVMDAQTRGMAGNLMRRFGQEGFADTYRYLRQFRVDSQALSQIACPSLALAGEGEGAEPLRQLSVFMQGTGGPSTSHIFTAAEGADGHCQNANPAISAAVALDWLDERFS
jgi:pimeloyl-ACP methyl ester carboxylesterase